MKPLWVQFCLDFPHLKKDYIIKSEFGLDYVKENIFREAKEMEVLAARKDQVIKISALMNSEGKKYFNMDFLVDRFLGVKGQDLVTNKKFKEKAAEKKKEAAAAEAGATGAEGATGGEAGSEGGEITI
jgi:hypothetical protein